MHKAEIIVALFLTLVGVIILIDAIRLGFGWGIGGPEAGYLPFYMAIGIILCSFSILVKGLKKLKKEGAGIRLIKEGGFKPVLWVLFPATGMVLLASLVGLHLAALIFLAFYMRVVGKIGWIKVILVSVLTPLIVYIVFEKWFLIPLPKGLWGEALMPF
jgi:putative tricarboxylic transport membrane protein